MSATTTPGSVPATQPKRSHHEPLHKVTRLQDAFEHPDFINRIKQAVPKHLSPDRMLAVFVQSVQKTPKLREVNMMSLLGAFLSVASVGLEPNTALQHAHLIPFEKKKWNPATRTRELERVDVNVIFGYQGLLELAYRSGLLRSIHADVVWKGDEFDFWYGSGSTLKHKPLGGVRAEGELPVWAYMHANMKGDAEMFEVMPMADILRVRDSTQAYSSALYALDDANKKGWKPPASYTEAPWVKHLVPMSKKTVFRAGSKWLPKSIELASAIALDELQERSNPNYGAVIEGSASILDGGLDALPDEYTGRMETDIGAGFSMQSDRGEPAETVRTEQQDPPKTQQQRQAPPPAATTTKPTPAAATTTTGFSAYLVDQWGEMVGDEHTNAMSFARALSDEAKRAASLSALLEANSEGIEDASTANSAARSVIDDLIPRGEQQQETAKPGVIAPVVLTTNGRGAAWPPYVKELKESLSPIDATLLDAWAEVNWPTIQRAPNVHLLLIVKAVTEHAAAVGGVVPKLIASAIQQVAGPAQAGASAGSTPPDPDEKWVEVTIGEVAQMTTIDQVRSLATAAAVKSKMSRLRQDKPGLFDRVDRAFGERVQQLGPPAEEDPNQDDGGIPGDPGPG
jgi:recombination protein RecT